MIPPEIDIDGYSAAIQKNMKQILPGKDTAMTELDEKIGGMVIIGIEEWNFPNPEGVVLYLRDQAGAKYQLDITIRKARKNPLIDVRIANMPNFGRGKNNEF